MGLSLIFVKNHRMSYNRRNLLLRIIDVQTIYKKHSKNFDGGCTDKYIYEQIIEPHYHISRATFYEYLKTFAEKQLKELDERRKSQLSLF